MGHRYLVVSDLHLCDVEDHADGWKSYKGSRFVYDAELTDLITRFETRGTGPLTLILNGDIIDFDLVGAVPINPPWPVHPTERFRGLDPSESKSAWKLERVLQDHPTLVTALAEFLARGNRVVYVFGNHDREMHFPEVQGVLVRALRDAASSLGLTLPEEPVRFEPWFFYEAGEIYAEHGQQYDYYSSFRHLLNPVVEHAGEPVIALPMGNLSNRYLLSRMGFFNPHASDYILNVYSYLTHWLRHYAFSRTRGILFNWFFGSVAVMAKLLQVKGRMLRNPPDDRPQMEEAVARSGLPWGTLHAIQNLQRRPITDKFFRIVREFWIDRLMIAIVMVLGTVALAVAPIPLWIKLMVPLTSFPLLYAIYEWAVVGESIFSIEHHTPNVARSIAGLLPVRVVTFGHAHKPRLLALDHGVSFVDTGTWAPIMDHGSPGDLARGYRNYLSVDFTGPDPVTEFGAWVRRRAKQDPPDPGAAEMSR